MSRITVTCQEIKKTYGEEETTVVALRGVSFEAHAGELLMIVGPSGCGKTTLLSIVSGILNEDEGECLIYGQNLGHLPNEEKTAFRGKNIGFVFQAFNLIPMLTAVENTAIPLILNGISPNEAQERAEQMLLKVGLDHRMHAPPAHLSGGEQQRVAICRSCIHSPKVIVCDEPTSALDQETGDKVLRLFKEIALTQDTTLIIVTHDTRIFPFADRILHMNDGVITNTTVNGGSSK